MKETIHAPNSKMILSVLFFGWIVSYIDRTVMSLAIAQMGTDLTLNASALGLALSSFFVGYALMQIPGGWLADRFGSRKVIIVAVLVWSVFTALTGFAWSLISLIIIRFLFGIGEGGYPSASTKAISDYFPADKRTKAQATMMTSNTVGAALAPIICAPLLVAFGWRNVFFLISFLGIIVVLLFLYITRIKGSFAGQAEGPKPGKAAYGELMRNPFVWKVLLIFFCVNIANWGLNSWMPSYLMSVQGINLSSVGYITAIPAAIGIAGMYFSGHIINRIGAYSKYGVIAGALAVALSLFLMTLAGSLTGVILCQCVAALFSAFVATFIFTLPHRAMKASVVGTAFGILNFGGQAAGILAPTIMGFMINASGGSYNSAFIFLTVCCMAAAVIAIFLPGAKHASVKPQGEMTIPVGH